MLEEHVSVRFDREPSIGARYDPILSHSTVLLHESTLVGFCSDMLYHRIGVDQVEGLRGEGQPAPVRDDIVWPARWLVEVRAIRSLPETARYDIKSSSDK